MYMCQFQRRDEYSVAPQWPDCHHYILIVFFVLLNCKISGIYQGEGYYYNIILFSADNRPTVAQRCHPRWRDLSVHKFSICCQWSTIINYKMYQMLLNLMSKVRVSFFIWRQRYDNFSDAYVGRRFKRRWNPVLNLCHFLLVEKSCYKYSESKTKINDEFMVLRKQNYYSESGNTKI